MPSSTITTPAGVTADSGGPTKAAVVSALVAGGHVKAASGRTSRSVPTPGFLVLKPRDVAYVEVFSTMRGIGHGYARTLKAAGFIVEDDAHRFGRLIVFKTPTA